MKESNFTMVEEVLPNQQSGVTTTSPVVPNKYNPKTIVDEKEAEYETAAALRSQQQQQQQQQSISIQPMLPNKECWEQKHVLMMESSSPRQYHVVERQVQFFSETLGIKLHRGYDGIVRVVSVTATPPPPPIAGGSFVVRRHEGDIQSGDVIREIAGCINLRRPITNSMWSDIVIFIKMAPRPISFLVARELQSLRMQRRKSEPRQQQQQELLLWQVTRYSQQEQFLPHMLLPSNAIGEEAVASAVESLTVERTTSNDSENMEDDIMEIKEFITHDIVEIENENDHHHQQQQQPIMMTTLKQHAGSEISKNNSNIPPSPQNNSTVSELVYKKRELAVADEDTKPASRPEVSNQETTETSSGTACEKSEEKSEANIDSNKHTLSEPSLNSLKIHSDELEEEEDIVEVEEDNRTTNNIATNLQEGKTILPHQQLLLEPSTEGNPINNDEESIIGGEILFVRGDDRPSYGAWDTLRWMSYSGSRQVTFFQQQIYRQLDVDTNKLKLFQSFWKTGTTKQYEQRALAIYEQPTLIVVLRRPVNLEELSHVLDLQDKSLIGDNATDLEKYWILESAVDPSTAKLRLSSLTTITSVVEAENADDRDRSCFEIIAPTETIVLTAVTTTQRKEQSFRDNKAYQETQSVEKSLAKAISAAHLKSHENSLPISDCSWKHQIVIGSLHSIVLSGNAKALNTSIEYAKKQIVREKDEGQNKHLTLSHVLDTKDDTGFSPLYYACKNKMHVIAQCLVNEGANVLSRQEPGDMSLLHVAARNLDDKMIGILLSASRPSRLDVNTLDEEYRTPMYVAATEGSLLDKRTDPSALGRCITLLRKFGGRMTITGTPKVNRHPVSVLSSLLLPEYLDATIHNLPFRYPLNALDNYKMKPLGSSLSAIYHYPVHFAVLALRKNLSRMLVDDTIVIRCLRILLERGFEPNERFECTHVSEIGTDEIQPFFGFAPIQLLAFVALELESLKDKIDSSILAKKTSLIKDVAMFLIRNGARLSIDPPPPMRKRKHAVKGGIDGIRTVDILPLKLDSDKQVLALLEVDGEKGLSKARQEWSDAKKVEIFINVDLLDNYTTIDDSDSPGGTDSQSCAICWAVFGTIMNRRHKCRVTGRFVCDDCSSKRLVVGGTEHRISDGQFLLFSGEHGRDTGPKGSPALANIIQRNTISTPGSTASQKREYEESVNRDTLFGTFLDRAATYVMGDVDEAPSSSTTSGLVATLDQTRDALNQRGERLNTLSDKSAQLVDASADFAKMAKQLNKQNDGGFFW